MKKHFLFTIVLLVCTSTIVHAQTRTLKKVMELQMPRTENDDKPGTRGAGVCWNTSTKKYYAAFCGNTEYPLAVFDVTGKILSGDTLSTMEDIRGIWYNAATNKIMANGYKDHGWIFYNLNKSGIPVSYKTIHNGMNQPSDQCVGSYDNKLKQVFFLNKSMVIRYAVSSSAPAAVDSVQIHWGRTKKDAANDEEASDKENEDYNYTNVIATSITGAEIGLLNTTLGQIELYNIKDGFLQQTLNLPAAATAEASFNFAYSNGMYWLFDMKNRKWTGYK